MRTLGILLALALGACSAETRPMSDADWMPLWTVTGLAEPESVAASPDGKTLYVANVGGEGDVKDGDGFISRVSAKGKLLDRQWVTGLNAPKGAIVSGDRLYVSDIDELVEIDVAAGRIAARHSVPGAVFLNDVAIAPDGTVLAADSGTGRIFGLKGGRAQVWSADPELKSVNGLLPEKSRLVVTTMEGKLLALDYATRKAKVLATGLGQADGVVATGAANYFVSEWPGRLFVVLNNGEVRELVDSRPTGTYINDFIVVGNLMVVPNWKPGRLAAYKVSERLLM